MTAQEAMDAAPHHGLPAGRLMTVPPACTGDRCKNLRRAGLKKMARIFRAARPNRMNRHPLRRDKELRQENKN
jgi:hypothetical protein